MARIAGVLLPDKKRVEAGLLAVHGIGRTRAAKIVAEAKIKSDLRVKDLTPEQESLLRDLVSRYTVEGDLKREVSQNIKRLQDVGCYRGTRHKKHLPVRGQRTKTNARTRKGKRVTMGSGRRKEAKK